MNRDEAAKSWSNQSSARAPLIAEIDFKAGWEAALENNIKIDVLIRTLEFYANGGDPNSDVWRNFDPKTDAWRGEKNGHITGHRAIQALKQWREKE